MAFRFVSRVARLAPAAAAAAIRSPAVKVGVALAGSATLVAFAAPATAQPLKTTPTVKSEAYYQAAYDAVSDLLEDLDYDDGSYAPVLLRLAWHAAGTYDKASGTGGSNGATMRFKAEAGHGANAGLHIARARLEGVKAKYPDLSYADLWSLAGVAAVQQMGGPTVPWRPGRVDASAESACSPDGRLPDAAKKADHVRAIFYRMGFNDQEIVALAGAHALGRCHTTRSGYDGPWTRSPTTFSNEYFRVLLEEKWVEKKWSGPKQYVDAKSGDLMMLPADMAFVEDPAFRKYVEVYAKDSDRFFRDFSAAFRKLEENGVPFPKDAPTITFRRKD